MITHGILAPYSKQPNAETILLRALDEVKLEEKKKNKT